MYIYKNIVLPTETITTNYPCTIFYFHNSLVQCQKKACLDPDSLFSACPFGQNNFMIELNSESRNSKLCSLVLEVLLEAQHFYFFII